MPRVPVAPGIELNVLVDDGKAGHPPVLLVHGLSSNARLWDGVRRVLGSGGHPVAAVDLRGHGLSDKPDDGYDFGTVAADLVAVHDALCWRDAIVAGLSWGGNVVIELAARHPDRVLGVVCVDGGWIELSRIGPWDVVRERLAPPHTTGTPAGTIEGHFRRVHPSWSDEAIAGALACFEVRDDGTVAPWLTRDRHLTILRHLWEHKPQETFERVRAPVAFIPAHQSDDPPADKRESIEQAAAILDDLETVWMRASHDVHAEDPEAVASVITRMSARVRR